MSLTERRRELITQVLKERLVICNEEIYRWSGKGNNE